MRSILTAQPSSNGMLVITDMEAGLEHLSRSTTRSSDVMLAVAEPYYKSLETAARVMSMAGELGIPRRYLVANKVRTPAEREAIRAFSEKRGLEVLATIPYDEKMAEASLIPESPLEYDSDTPGVKALEQLATRLEAL